ncbi:MAG: NTP transferase domain-containing protein [Candidatus Omnitrophica bacterium]|nr:NTP transferase domain-containing protein [Candidatus Omnitrophota bacterium]MBU3933708.1 NTP transferase domain-containing protein [Candidatus Omnitrophota bacterium]
MKDIVGIILAAGEGTRMKSAHPKVLHKVGGKPMLEYMLELLRRLEINRCIVVVGHKAEKVKEILKKSSAGKVKTVRQPKLLGSADAVWQAKDSFSNFKGSVLVVYGDTPLISEQSLKKLVRFHKMNQVSCTILTAILKNPTGFGRVLRGEDNRIVRIVEEQDADTYEKAIGEINVGAYCFRAKELFSVLEQIKPDNVKKEYYLTDAIGALSKKRAKIGSVYVGAQEEAFGINSRHDLSRASTVINKRNIERLASGGVTVMDPATTFIYGDIEAGRDTIIYPHTVIEGRVKIGKGCQIGPFARLRSGTVLEDDVQLGNFVEIVRSRVGSGSKIKHHSYIGDTTIGKAVNVGCGTITANYDGKNKNPIFIGDGAFIGVGTILIAPVKIGKKAITGAGSVVTKNKNVPAGATVAGVPARILKKRAR